MIDDYENWAGFDDYFKLKNNFQREHEKNLIRKFRKTHNIKNLERSIKFDAFVDKEFNKYMAKKKMKRMI